MNKKDKLKKEELAELNKKAKLFGMSEVYFSLVGRSGYGASNKIKTQRVAES